MQLVCIKWGTAVSQYFRISNGVRQGGILSPKLFALYIYMNGLSGALSHCKAGCYINEQCMNHIMYADAVLELGGFVSQFATHFYRVANQFFKMVCSMQINL